MQKIAGYVLAVALAAANFPASAQQRPDPNADVAVANPTYPKGTGPIIGIESGHRELHTITTGFSGFAALLANDGYRLQDFHAALTPANLAKVQVLVIANPRSDKPSPTGSPLDSLSAFTDEEIATLHAWVESGGALLITADHPPYAGTVRPLAASFGFTINRYAAHPKGPPGAEELFNRANGDLIDGPLTQGVDQVQTFFGTAFTAPPPAAVLLKLDSGWSFEAKGVAPIPASNADWRAASLVVGEGRVILVAETGELSAQISARNMKMGFNAPGATGNRQFVRNITRWLATGDAAILPLSTVAPSPAAPDSGPGIAPRDEAPKATEGK
jgi:hypothetical protein